MGVVPSSSCEWVGSGWNVRSVCMWCVLGGELIMMVSQFLTCVHIRKLQFYVYKMYRINVETLHACLTHDKAPLLFYVHTSL